MKNDTVSWHVDAACADNPEPDLWFPNSTAQAARAIAICELCPVINDCLAYALRHQIEHGIWGGKPYRERLRVQKVGRGRRPVVLKTIQHGTMRGYWAHKRRGEDPCDECRFGAAQHQKAYKKGLGA